MSDVTGEMLDLASQRRREKEVVDVELEKELLVVFCLRPPGRPEEGYYGLPASKVEAIVPFHGATFVPGTPPWILGVVNVRGEIESVLDLKAVLGLGQVTPDPKGGQGSVEGSSSRLLIAQEGELRSGLLVDEMVDIVEVSAAAISPPPVPLEGGKGTYISGEAEYAGSSLVILELAELFHRALETDRV